MLGIMIEMRYILVIDCYNIFICYYYYIGGLSFSDVKGLNEVGLRLKLGFFLFNQVGQIVICFLNRNNLFFIWDNYIFMWRYGEKQVTWIQGKFSYFGDIQLLRVGKF